MSTNRRYGRGRKNKSWALTIASRPNQVVDEAFKAVEQLPPPPPTPSASPALFGHIKVANLKAAFSYVLAHESMMWGRGRGETKPWPGELRSNKERSSAGINVLHFFEGSVVLRES